MSAHSIHLQAKRRKSPLIIRISYLEEIPANSRTCSTHPWKRAIGVRAIEVLLYIVAYETNETFFQNRVSNYCSFVRSLFPKATFLDIYF